MIGRLFDYLESIKARDPAPRTRWEVLLYPGVHAVAFHRLAHWLYRGELYFVARLVNHIARILTGIDIHPGARIGRNFFIDHGFVVIGETAEIGDDVTIYQCVTLGGTDPANGVAGKRHPTLEDGVIVGSGAQVLGPVTVGARARIGANAVVTRDVPEGATMVGIPARAVPVDAEAYAKPFMPYGTPCSERFDPQTQQLDLLKCEVEMLRKRLGGDDRGARRDPSPPESRRRRLMGVVTPFPRPAPAQVVFDRAELNVILNVYGRMVAEGEWRDYAVSMDGEAAVFSAFRRAAERPEVQVVKRPALRLKQGQYSLIGEGGATLRRGHELKPVLAPLERRLLKLVDA